MEKHAGVNGPLFVLVRIEVSPTEAQPHLKHITGKKFLSFGLLYSVAQLAWIRFIFYYYEKQVKRTMDCLYGKNITHFSKYPTCDNLPKFSGYLPIQF